MKTFVILSFLYDSVVFLTFRQPYIYFVKKTQRRCSYSSTRPRQGPLQSRAT